MNKLFFSLGLITLLSTNILFAQATDDNEIRIDQEGDTLTLYIDQIGFGNKISQTSALDDKMVITGTTLTIDIDMIGNSNKLYGPLVADTSDFDLSFTGDSNVMDWNIGDTGSADDSVYDITVTGDSNTWDLDQGYQFSAERLDLDMTILGNSNVFDLDFESDDNTFNWEITGDSNNLNVLMKDGAHTQTVDYTGDGGDIDINQISGTCVSGAGTSCASPDAKIIMDIDSDNATIQINQKDSLTIVSALIHGVCYAQDPIGDIVESTGVGGIVRNNERLPSNVGSDIVLYDEAQTVNGRMLIEFLDEEELALTEHTRVYIDEVYYDPNPSLSKMSIRMAQGTARFASGSGKKIKKANIQVSTPTAQIAINGTDFTTTIDELGRSLVVLLPDDDGFASGVAHELPDPETHVPDTWLISMSPLSPV